MKKNLISACLFVFSVSLFGQIDVISIQVVPGTQNTNFCHPTFSKQGDYMLFTTPNFRGLTKYDIASGETNLLTNADNAGYLPQVSDGGKVVVFRTVEYKNNLRYTSIKSVNVENNKITTIDSPSREQYAFNFVGGQVKIAKRKSIVSKRLATDIRTINNSYIVAIEDQNLVLYNANKRTVLNPNGKQSYIWPSISPDEKHIVYMALGETCTTYVCNIDGSNPIALGYLGAPVWLGNDWIVGMEDKDDGHQTISSVLKAAKIDGSHIQILPTPEQPIAMYPAASQDAIAYHANNAIYLMHINKR